MDRMGADSRPLVGSPNIQSFVPAQVITSADAIPIAGSAITITVRREPPNQLDPYSLLAQLVDAEQTGLQQQENKSATGAIQHRDDKHSIKSGNNNTTDQSSLAVVVDREDEKDQKRKDQRIDKLISEEKRTVFQHYAQRFAGDWVTGSSTAPSSTEAGLRWAIHKKTWWQDRDFTWNKTWPLALAGLLVHDVYKFYTAPDDRYGLDTLNKIFGGLLFTNPHNYWQTGIVSQQNWSNHLGSDLVGDYRYWIGVSAAVGLPLLHRTLNHISRRHWQRPVDKSELNEFKGFADASQGFGQDFFPWLLPNYFPKISKRADQLEHAEFAVLHLQDTKLSETDRTNFSNALNTIANQHGYLAQQHALQALANIARSLTVEEGTYHPTNILSPVVNKNLQVIRHKAVATLRKHAAAGSVYAKYLLWKLGKNESAGLGILFWLTELYRLYAKLRLLELIVQKARGAYEYFEEKNACESDLRFWQYASEIGDYSCFSCPPQQWQIYFRNAYSSQGCLDGLLARKQPPQEILAKLLQANNEKALLWHPDITHINLSLQEIAAWSETDFKALLSGLIKAGIRKLDLLDLSSPVYISDWPQDGKIQALANFLQQVRVKKLNLNNQGIGSDQMQILVQGMQSNSYETIIFSNNALGDAGVKPLAEGMKANTMDIVDLNLANNGVSDYGISQLSFALQNSALTALDVSGNPFGDPGCANISATFPQTRLQRVTLNNIPLSDACITNLGVGISATPSLQNVSMVDCNLDDDAMEIFCPFLSVSSLTCWDISNNQVTGEGFAVIAQNMQGASLRRLDVSDNNIDKLTIGATYLPNTNVTVIVISGNEFTPSDFIQFSQLAPNITTLEELIAADAGLDGASISAFFDSLTNSTNRLRRVNFNGNAMDDAAGARMAIFLASPNNHLTHLSLVDNPITGVTGNYLAMVLAQNETSLLVMDLSGTKIDGATLQAIARSFSNARIEQAYFNTVVLGNTGNDAVRSALQTFITPIPHMEALGDPAISIDQARILNRTARATTSLQAYGFANDNLNDTTLRTACRLAGPMAIDIRSAQLSGNNVSPDFDPLSCQTSAASRAQPFSANLLLNGLAILFLAYLFYRLLASVTNRFFNCRQNFLGGHSKHRAPEFSCILSTKVDQTLTLTHR